MSERRRPGTRARARRTQQQHRQAAERRRERQERQRETGPEWAERRAAEATGRGECGVCGAELEEQGGLPFCGECEWAEAGSKQRLAKEAEGGPGGGVALLAFWGECGAEDAAAAREAGHGPDEQQAERCPRCGETATGPSCGKLWHAQVEEEETSRDGFGSDGEHLPQTEAEAEDAALADLLGAVGSGVLVRAWRREQAAARQQDAEAKQAEDDARDEAEADAKALLLAARELRRAACGFELAGLLDEAKDANEAADDASAAACRVLARVHGVERADELAADLEVEVAEGKRS